MKTTIMAVRLMGKKDRLHLAEALLLCVVIAVALELFFLGSSKFFASGATRLFTCWRYTWDAKAHYEHVQQFYRGALANPWSVHYGPQFSTREAVHMLLYYVLAALCLAEGVLVAWLACVLSRALLAGECDKLKQSTAIEANHGSTILAVILRLRYAALEYDVAFTETGKKLSEGTLLSPAQCTIPCVRTVRNIGNCIGIHNHPFSTYPHSAADFSAAIVRREGKSLVVAGRFVYTLELTPACWELDPQKVFKHHKQLLHQAQCKASNDSQLRRAYVEACQATATKFGMTFKEERCLNVLFRELHQAAKRRVRAILTVLLVPRVVRDNLS